MPERKFAISLRSPSGAEARHAVTIALSPIPSNQQNQARYAHLAPVPVHAASEITPETEADCHLLLWELDRFKVDRYFTNDEGDLGEKQNRLLATFHGVVEVSNGRYRFRPIGEPMLQRDEADPLDGSVKIRLSPAGQGADAEFEVPLVEYEHILELAACLHTDPQDETFAASTELSPHQVRNVDAALRRQIAEWGGIAVAFVPDHCAGENKADLSQWSASEREFPRQAEDMLGDAPTFKVEGDRVVMGFYVSKGWDTWGATIDALRTRVASQLGLPEEARPPVSVLEIFAHGIRAKTNLWGGVGEHSGGYAKPGSLNTGNVQAFVDALSEHLSDRVVIPIFACSTGRSIYDQPRDNRDDPDYGRRPIGEELGADSLAWKLQRTLRRAGHRQATVWGHTMAAHTTRNRLVNVFSGQGSAQILSSMLGAWRVQAPALRTYRVKCSVSHQPSEADYAERYRTANRFRVLCVQNGMHLPWAWAGGADADEGTPGWTQEGHDRARETFDAIAGRISGAPTEPDDFTFSDRTRRFITGVRAGVADERLSTHFRWSDYGSPPILGVRLARMVQLLRHRSDRGIQVVSLGEHGQSAVLRASPHSRAAIDAMERAGMKMVEEALLTSMSRDGDTLRVSVSGLEYDGEYLVGVHEEVADAMVTPTLAYSRLARAIRPMRVRTRLVEVFEELEVSMGVAFALVGARDGGDTLVFTTPGRARDALASSRQRVLDGTLTGAACTRRGENVISMSPAFVESDAAELVGR